MADEEVKFEEILIAPLEEFVKSIGEAVCEAQNRIDKASLETQKKLKERYPELAEVGYQVTWYQIPEVQVELKMVLHYEEKKEEEKEKKYNLFWSPYNAKYKSYFDLQAKGASMVRFKIVPIPPPVALTIPPIRKEEL